MIIYSRFWRPSLPNMLVELITPAGDYNTLESCIHFSVVVVRLMWKLLASIFLETMSQSPSLWQRLAVVYSFALQSITELQNGQVSPYTSLFRWTVSDLHFHPLLILWFYIYYADIDKKHVKYFLMKPLIRCKNTSSMWVIFCAGFTCWREVQAN